MQAIVEVYKIMHEVERFEREDFFSPSPKILDSGQTKENTILRND